MNAELDRQHTAQQVVEIVPLVMRVVAAELRRAEHAIIPAHLGVLFLLEERPRNLSELAEQQAVSLPTMSNTVTTMVREGWVRRSPAERDRRMVLVEITPAGQAILADMSGHIIGTVARLLAPLSAEELHTLHSGLAILRESFVHGSHTI
jgi:DNA-binding MarR family transcriptional regulator